MQSRQPFLREVRWAQALAFTWIILALLNIGITTVLQRNQQAGIVTIIALPAILGYWLFFGFLAWQLGKQREWARKIMLVFAYIQLFGNGWLILRQDLVSPVQKDMLYKVDSYVVGIVFGLLSAFLAFYLSRSAVRDACHRQQEKTSASENPVRT